MAGIATGLTDYGSPFAPVSTFNYIGRSLLEEDGNFLAVVLNLKQVWKNWVRLMWLLGREGADDRMTGCQGCFTLRWYMKSCYMGWICGS